MLAKNESRGFIFENLNFDGLPQATDEIKARIFEILDTSPAMQLIHNRHAARRAKVNIQVLAEFVKSQFRLENTQFPATSGFIARHGGHAFRLVNDERLEWRREEGPLPAQGAFANTQLIPLSYNRLYLFPTFRVDAEPDVYSLFIVLLKP